MARYNSVTPISSISTSATIPAPTAGLLTTFTGTAPYTVTLANPALYSGITQTFFNSTSGVITLSSPNGVLKGPGFTSAGSQTIPAGATYSIMSDGTDYVIVNNEGGPQVSTNFTVNNTLTVTGTTQLNGSTVAASSAFTPSSTYDLVTLTYLQTKYGALWTTQSASFTAGGRYWVDTSSTAITMTLPASPTSGDQIQVIDYSGTFATRNLTVGNNGNKIMRITDTMTVSTNGAAFTLVWSGSTNGWLMATGI
jgi:hypothetical protein